MKEHIKAYFPRESMWVKVVEEYPDGVVRGFVDNDPLFTDVHGFTLGDDVFCVPDDRLRHGYFAVGPVRNPMGEKQ